MKLNDIQMQEEVAVKETVVEKKVNVVKEVITSDNYLDFVDAWKEEHKFVYRNFIDGEPIIWRPLNRSEYRQIIKDTKRDDLDKSDIAFLREEEILKVACLYPNAETVKLLIEKKAGFSFVLSEEILGKSGFDISGSESL